MTEVFFGLVSGYGLPVIALTAFLSCLAVPLPTFAVMLAGGAFAASGDLVLWQVLAVAFLGAVAGDQTGFQVGRLGGPAVIRLIETRSRRGPLVARAQATLRRWGGIGVFFSTWLVAPLGPWVNLVAGAARLAWPKFTLWDLAGEAIWVTGYVGLGFAFGSQLEALVDLAASWGGLVSVAATALLTGAILLVSLAQRRRRA